MRNAIEMYQDLQLDYPANDATLYELKRTIGPLLYVSPFPMRSQSSTVANRSRDPTGNRRHYLLPSLHPAPHPPRQNPRLPLRRRPPRRAHHLPRTCLRPAPRLDRAPTLHQQAGRRPLHLCRDSLDLLLRAQVRPPLEQCVFPLSLHPLFRTIANPLSNPGPNVPESLAETLASVQALWSTIDTAHLSMQRLQNILATLPHTPPSAASPPWDSDHHVLLSVRLDARLLELCNLIHGFLGTRTGSGKAGEELEVMKMGSELGVRKGLKVLAYVLLPSRAITSGLVTDAFCSCSFYSRVRVFDWALFFFPRRRR